MYQPTFRFVVRDDHRLDAPGGQGGDGRQTDCPRADDDGNLAGSDARAPDVELPDGERVDERDGVVGDVARNCSGHELGHDEELPEAALRFRVLTDDLGATGATIDQQDRHRGDACPDRELLGAAGTTGDDLTDELVSHHDVTVRS